MRQMSIFILVDNLLCYGMIVEDTHGAWIGENFLLKASIATCEEPLSLSQQLHELTPHSRF